MKETLEKLRSLLSEGSFLYSEERYALTRAIAVCEAAEAFVNEVTSDKALMNTQKYFALISAIKEV